jgi:hypothetical protein
MFEPVYSYGLLALELSPGTPASHATLSVADAERLGALMAGDLRPWCAPHRDIDISLAGVLFDPVEILRPRWPVHAEIARLNHLAPKSADARLLCLGASDGRMPAGLQPDPDYRDGPLRWLPFVISGPAEQLLPVQNGMEAELMERGMAGAATALQAQELFGAAIEHARYMTLHDGVAMMAMQYGHNGLEPVWPLIETALFAPQQPAWLDAEPEPLIFLNQGIGHIAMLDYHQWAIAQPDASIKSGEQLETRFQMYQMRQRQLAALLQAHGLEVHFDFCPDTASAREILQR